MPIYDFACNNCKISFEKIKKINERDLLINCPTCNSIATRIAIPSSISVFCRSLKNNNVGSDLASTIGSDKNQDSTTYQNDLTLTNCHIEGAEIGISVENTILKGENINFKNVTNPIEHKNSKIELKKVKYKNTKSPNK